jgi:2-iminoacetate synthase ThiH
MLKTLMLRFSLSPLKALAELGQRLLPAGAPAQLSHILEIVRSSPLILQIETTNVCNARCAFCAYAGMKRPKGVMDAALFEKVICDYVAMAVAPSP